MKDIATVRAGNNVLVDSLTSDDRGMQKKASEGITDMLRMNAREDGITRNIHTPEKITPGMLQREVNTAKPVLIRDKEPESAGATNIPFNSVPMNHEIRAPRYRIMFSRITSPRLVADRVNLLTYDYDLKQVLQDLQLKDILAEEDRKYIFVCDEICDNDTTVANAAAYLPIVDGSGFTRAGSLAGSQATDRFAATGGAHGFMEIGAIDRKGLANARKALGSAKNRLSATRSLINTNTAHDIVAEANANDVGDRISADLWEKGFFVTEQMGSKYMVTIKHHLVEDGVMYMYAPEDYLGNFCVLEDVTIANKSDSYMIETFAYECVGSAIKNGGAVAKAKFAESIAGVSWTATA